MKILYVEDELSLNVKRIINLFEKILTADEKRGLNNLIDEQKELQQEGLSSYIDNQEILELVNNSILDICCSFPEAVKKIKNNYQDYDLFIIDRNLEKEEYELSDIQKILSKFSENKYSEYLAREGDYLLEMLIGSNIDCNTKFYFLTANANDSLRCKESFENAITLENFSSKNILEKGNLEHTEKVLTLIEDFKKGNYRFKMKEVFEIFDKNLLSKELEKEFIQTLRQMNNYNLPTIKDNLARIRRIQEGIYIALNKYSDDVIPNSLLRGDKGGLKMRPTINHFGMSGKHSGIIEKFADNIYGLTSESGSHTSYENPDYMPTKYTVQSLTYALCDLLLWFKAIVDK